MHVHDKIIDQVNTIPQFGSVMNGDVAGWYKIYRREHLHGFTPLASFGKMSKPTEFAHGESSKHWKKQQQPYVLKVGVYEMWLLLEKAGKLYVDHYSLRERRFSLTRTFYGIKSDLPLVQDMILPTEVFDAFRDVVGAERWKSQFLEG